MSILRFLWPDLWYRHPCYSGERTWVEKFFIGQEHLFRLVLILGTPVLWIFLAHMFSHDMGQDCLSLDCGFVEHATPYVASFGCVLLFWWVAGYGYLVARWHRTDPDKSTWLAAGVTAVVTYRHLRRTGRI